MIQEFHFPDRRENSGKWLDNEQKYIQTIKTSWYSSHSCSHNLLLWLRKSAIRTRRSGNSPLLWLSRYSSHSCSDNLLLWLRKSAIRSRRSGNILSYRRQNSWWFRKWTRYCDTAARIHSLPLRLASSAARRAWAVKWNFEQKTIFINKVFFFSILNRKFQFELVPKWTDKPSSPD